jgi:hypothetical protein
MQTLILDGIWGNHLRWEGLRKRISDAVGPCEIWHYRNSGLRDIEALAGDLIEKTRKFSEPIALIGYSLGGIVIREAVRQAPDLPLSAAAFLHSPHKGSIASWALPLPACRQLRPGNPFLRRLQESPWTVPVLATWCPYDLMVCPGSSAAWPGAQKIIRSDVPAHAWPIVSGGIHAEIVKFLRDCKASKSTSRA